MTFSINKVDSNKYFTKNFLNYKNGVESPNTIAKRASFCFRDGAGGQKKFCKSKHVTENEATKY